MRIIIRLLVVALGLIVAVFALQIVASESNEVVVLGTAPGPGEADDAVSDTRLWIVDLDGVAYLRAGSAQAGWYARLVADPRITLARGDRVLTYRAVPDVDRRAEVNTLMRDKYGWADAYVSLLFGRDDAVPVRLEPRDG